MADDPKMHDDLRLLKRARRERWEIPEEFKATIVARLMNIVETAPDDLALKAISETRSLEQQNQKDDHKFVDARIQREHDRLDEIAADLGIERSLIESLTGEASSGDSVVEAGGERSD